jgi:cytochrome c oxidase assembly protein subunit 15
VKQLARIATTSVALTYLHLVFGGIVRITGSGMGCGDHWPRCNGSWIPPFNDPTVMIEWTHRLLALLVILSVLWLLIAARGRASEPGVSGPGGVYRPAGIALFLVIGVALLGMVTVKLGNTTFATLAHWTFATALLGVLTVAAVRAGALGGAAARAERGTPRAMRSLGAGAALAFLVVVLGGLVAKFPGAAAACPDFPLCGDSPANIPAGAAHVQLAHRVLAYLLFFHTLAVGLAVTRRLGEAAAVKRAAKWAAALVVSQLILGAMMVLSMFPMWLRVLHQAVGVGVWLAMFSAAYLAREAVRSTTAAATA